MRKFLLTALVTIGMIGSSVAQMAIPGSVFADNPARFNGRKVTIKNIQLVANVQGMNQPGIVGGPVSGPVTGPGMVGPSTTSTQMAPCRPPRGFSKVTVNVLEKPDYNGCFFMADAMYKQLERELGGQTVDAQITFRGDARTGYNVSFYRLGK